MNGKALQELALRDRYHVNVVLMTRTNPNEATLHLEAEPTLQLALNDLCIVVGRRENINRFERECGLSA